MNLPPNLCYTLAFDRPGQDDHRRMARLLVTSLLRTGWHGRIVVFRNQPRAALPEGHPQVEEIMLEPTAGISDRSMIWKFRVRDRLDLSGISKVLYLDCDCLALRKINQLMMGAWDIYTVAERLRVTGEHFNAYLTDAELASLHEQRGLNAGTFAIRAEHFHTVMAEWERIDAGEPLRPTLPLLRDQQAWNRLILDTPLRHRNFDAREIGFPLLNGTTYHGYRHASIVHAAGPASPGEKLSLLYGLWMEVFAGDRLEELTASS